MRPLSALLLCAALPACAPSVPPTDPAPAAAPASSVAPCVYPHGTALAHLPDGREIAAAWQAVDTGAALASRDRILPLVPFDAPPELENRNVVGREIARSYPPRLRDAGVTGGSSVLVWIGPDGRVADARALRSDPDPAFGDAAVQVLRAARFRPARAGGCAVPVFTVVPITFSLHVETLPPGGG